jgi:hypothetical protein
VISGKALIPEVLDIADFTVKVQIRYQSTSSFFIVHHSSVMKYITLRQ